MLTDIPVDVKSLPLAKVNINPDKNFLVATKSRNAVLWKIFSAP